MARCSVCGRVSAGGDHLGCAELRRLEAEAAAGAPAEAPAGGDLAPELRALLGRLGAGGPSAPGRSASRAPR